MKAGDGDSATFDETGIQAEDIGVTTWAVPWFLLDITRQGESKAKIAGSRPSLFTLVVVCRYEVKVKQLQSIRFEFL